MNNTNRMNNTNVKTAIIGIGTAGVKLLNDLYDAIGENDNFSFIAIESSESDDANGVLRTKEKRSNSNYRYHLLKKPDTFKRDLNINKVPYLYEELETDVLGEGAKRNRTAARYFVDEDSNVQDDNSIFRHFDRDLYSFLTEGNTRIGKIWMIHSLSGGTGSGSFPLFSLFLREMQKQISQANPAYQLSLFGMGLYSKPIRGTFRSITKQDDISTLCVNSFASMRELNKLLWPSATNQTGKSLVMYGDNQKYDLSQPTFDKYFICSIDEDEARRQGKTYYQKIDRKIVDSLQFLINSSENLKLLQSGSARLGCFDESELKVDVVKLKEYVDLKNKLRECKRDTEEEIKKSKEDIEDQIKKCKEETEEQKKKCKEETEEQKKRFEEEIKAKKNGANETLYSELWDWYLGNIVTDEKRREAIKKYDRLKALEELADYCKRQVMEQPKGFFGKWKKVFGKSDEKLSRQINNLDILIDIENIKFAIEQLNERAVEELKELDKKADLTIAELNKKLDTESNELNTTADQSIADLNDESEQKLVDLITEKKIDKCLVVPLDKAKLLDGNLKLEMDIEKISFDYLLSEGYISTKTMSDCLKKQYDYSQSDLEPMMKSLPTLKDMDGVVMKDTPQMFLIHNESVANDETNMGENSPFKGGSTTIKGQHIKAAINNSNISVATVPGNVEPGTLKIIAFRMGLNFNDMYYYTNMQYAYRTGQFDELSSENSRLKEETVGRIFAYPEFFIKDPRVMYAYPEYPSTMITEDDFEKYWPNCPTVIKSKFLNRE